MFIHMFKAGFTLWRMQEADIKEKVKMKSSKLQCESEQVARKKKKKKENEWSDGQSQQVCREEAGLGQERYSQG